MGSNFISSFNIKHLHNDSDSLLFLNLSIILLKFSYWDFVVINFTGYLKL